MTTQHFCDHVFRTLDLDGNGSLDFREYVLAMDLVEAKTPEDKLKWAFKMLGLFSIVAHSFSASFVGMTQTRAEQ